MEITIREKIGANWARFVDLDIIAVNEIQGREYDSNLTFLGTLETYYEEISSQWKTEATRKGYDADYANIILPNLAEHNNRTIDMYTIHDVDETINRIIQKGKQNKKSIYMAYADTTIRHFRRLLYLVFKAGANHGLCNDIFWDRQELLGEITPKRAARYLTRLGRSLTPEKEKALFRRLFDNPATKRGQDILVLLMWVLGTRNAETCSISFCDIKEMPCHPGTYTIIIFKHLESGTNIVTTGGKTPNADREIPITDKVAKFLFKRKEYVERWLESKEIYDVDVNSLPIGCFGDNCLKRCDVDDLTAAAQIIFQEIGLDKKMLAFVDAEITREGSNIELSEREPTVYMLRRNLATIMLILGFEEAEIQGVMGHDIIDLYETRNEFVYEDNLFRIKKRMEYRPLIGNRSYQEIIDLEDGVDTQYSLSNISDVAVKLGERKGTIKIHVQGREPGDQIKVQIGESNIEVVGKYYEEEHVPVNERTVNIIKKFQNSY